MSENNKCYSLQILFDGKQVTLEELQEKAENALHNYLPDIDLKVDATHSASLRLAIKGTLKVVDSCHDKINKILLNQGQLKGVRLLDEAGDYIRQQAYPILAEIEQRFRVFVSQALVEVSGFDWWDTLAPADIRSKVQQLREKHQEDGSFLTPLEYTQFDDLITIITAEVSEWSKDKLLSVTDLIELLSNCESINEVKIKLEKKINKFPYWDIFVRYFQDRKQWEQIKKDINFVINVRHKVMHHRPIRFGVIAALSNKKTEILTLLDSAKPKLSEQERGEAQEDIKNIRQRKPLADVTLPQVQDIGLQLQKILQAMPELKAIQSYQDMGLQLQKSLQAIPELKAIQSYQDMGLQLQKILQAMPELKAIQPLTANFNDSVLDSDMLDSYKLEQREKKNELKSDETDHQLEQNTNKDDKSEPELQSDG